MGAGPGSPGWEPLLLHPALCSSQRRTGTRSVADVRTEVRRSPGDLCVPSTRHPFAALPLCCLPMIEASQPLRRRKISSCFWSAPKLGLQLLSPQPACGPPLTSLLARMVRTTLLPWPLGQHSMRSALHHLLTCLHRIGRGECGTRTAGDQLPI